MEFFCLLIFYSHFFGDLFYRWPVAELLLEIFKSLPVLPCRIPQMFRGANGARLTDKGAGDRLADPPGRVGGKFIAPLRLKLVDGVHESHISLLDEVKEGETVVLVAFCDGNDEAEVSPRELIASCDELPMQLLYGLHAFMQPRGGFLHEVQKGTAFFNAFRLYGITRRAVPGFVCMYLSIQRLKALVDFPERFHHRCQFLLAQSQFFDESHRMLPPPVHGVANFLPFLLPCVLEVFSRCFICCENAFERAKVGGKVTADPMQFGSIGIGNLHGAAE